MIGIMFAAALSASDIEFCNSLERLALAASGAYQRGVSVTELYHLAGGEVVYQGVISEATSGPIFSTPEMQNKASRDVAAKVAKYCILEMSK